MTTETKKPRKTQPPKLGNLGPQPEIQRRAKPPRVYKDKIMRIAEENDAEKLNKMKDRVKDMMESFMEGAGKKFGAKRGGKMSTGGEVDIDMTTEMDV